jgi:TfoX/Sxy family transcriptional regulator of competence genes
MAQGRKRSMPKFEKAPPELVQAFGELIGRLPGVERRTMFGYPAAFCHGQMFASLFGGKMIVRLPEDERARLLAVEGATLFEPIPGRSMREYVALPQGMVEQPSEASAWLEQALAYAASLPAKEPKKGRPKAGKA